MVKTLFNAIRTSFSSRRIIALWLVGIMVLFAGCGGLLGGGGEGNTPTEQMTTMPKETSEMKTGGATTSGSSTATETDITTTNNLFTTKDGTTVGTDTPGGGGTISVETSTVTGENIVNGTMVATSQADPETTSSSQTQTTVVPTEMNQSSTTNTTDTLNIAVEPNTAQAENLTVTIRANVPDETAATGIRKITIKLGDGLNYSGIHISNLPTLGIDRGSNAPRTTVDESLIFDVATAKVDEKSGITITFSETVEVGPEDEIIAVLPNSVSSGAAGSYTVTVTVNGNNTVMGNYTISG